ncbi:MAG: hypothetical protein IJD94_05190 [Clostridia bacterium]|nr:hypothetical protein [Clostridia bacterium]
MPKTKPLGNADMKAVALAKRSASAMAAKEEKIVRQLDALCALTGMKTDKAFADLLGMSDGRYRYLKRHPGTFKLHEIRLVNELAAQYKFEFDWEARS